MIHSFKSVSDASKLSPSCMLDDSEGRVVGSRCFDFGNRTAKMNKRQNENKTHPPVKINAFSRLLWSATRPIKKS